ncbi:MAG TPA: hypothetical protein VL918_01310 [Sphingobium sp.]|nr:hypothetical protein [Sphingobium sp.]
MRLEDRIALDLSADVPAEVSRAATLLATTQGVVAVLFYGSVLRTGKLDDMLDFYVLTSGDGGWLWPDISFRAFCIDGRTIRAKVATMPLTTFERAASGRLLDTTVWTRFAQPGALVWSRDADRAGQVARAVADAVRTAARFAAVIGPREGDARAYWLALFAATYRTELRVERAGRGAQIVDHDSRRYEDLLPLAWDADGIDVTSKEGRYRPMLSRRQRRRIKWAWRVRAAAGKPINIARLIKAAFTLEGAARYALWKIERHAGVRIEATPWRERHPILAAPGVLWRVLRAAAR